MQQASRTHTQLRVSLPLVGLLLLSHLQAQSLHQLVEEQMTWPNHGLSNPFLQTELELQIQAPTGRSPNTFRFFGFHDGDGKGGQSGDVWKFRIMFDAPGDWSITARFVNPATGQPMTGSPAAKQFQYTVSATPAASNHGHIRIDPDNNSRFRHKDGTPFVPFPIHASMLLERSLSISQQWIDAHAALGVNALTVRFHSEAGPALSENGFYHFLGKNGSRILRWPGSINDFDYTRYDIAAWTHNEKVIQMAEDKGIKLSIWFGISGINEQYWSYGPKDFTDNVKVGPQQKQFIRYLLARWAAMPTWWHWTVDSEYEETGGQALARNQNYAAALKAENPWSTLVTTHVLLDWTPKNAPEFDFVTLQRMVPDQNNLVGAVKSLVEFNSGYGKPVYNAEGVWYLANADRTRIALMAHIMAGGYAHVAHGQSEHKVSSWGSDWNFVQARHKEDAKVVGNLAQAFNKIPALEIGSARPSHSLVSEASGLEAFCLAAPSQTYLVWLPSGGQASLDLKGVSGEFQVTRYLGKDFQDQKNLGTVNAGSIIQLEAAPKMGFGNDYLFVIRNKGALQLGISTPPKLTAYIGKPFVEVLQAAGGIAALQWKLESGNLPNGILLVNNTLTGTPLTQGESTFELSVTDGNSTAKRSFTLTVAAAPETDPPVISNFTVQNISLSGATVAWTTNEPASSRVQWGNAKGSYTGESGVVATRQTAHAVPITGPFTADQQVFVLIITSDTVGNTSTFEGDFQVKISDPGLIVKAYHGGATPPQIVKGGLTEGANSAMDRQDTWKNVPNELKNLPYLMTSRDDKAHALDADGIMYEIESGLPTIVLALVDGSPAWLEKDGWEGVDLPGPNTHDTDYKVYRKQFAAGVIPLKRWKAGESQGTSYLFQSLGGVGSLNASKFEQSKAFFFHGLSNGAFLFRPAHRDGDVIDAAGRVRRIPLR